jgi:hypothetical protein
MRFGIIAILTSVLGLAMWLGTGTTVCAAGCGLKPLKPLKPVGCDDLVAQCICDSKGQNCAWQWVCVKNPPK